MSLMSSARARGRGVPRTAINRIDIPRTAINRTAMTMITGLAALSAGLVPLTQAPTAGAAPLDRHPSTSAQRAGITASGGGYAGWALRQQPTTFSRRTTAAVATPSGVPGVDVSGYQGKVNWASWYSQGKRWAYTKATEGTSYTNPYFGQQYSGSYNAGLMHGAYHFARPDSGSGAKQADYFVAHGGGWSADGRTLPGALDIEDNYTGGNRCWGNTPAENVAWVKSFMAEYRRLTGRDALIYTNISFWKDCLGNSTAFSQSSPFWLAYWSSSRPSSYPGGWTYDTLWQYSGTGSTDLDVFNGTSARLKVLASGSDPATAANLDSDGDGLTNAQEAKYGTNPNKKDTDGDGLSDKAEVTGTTILHYGLVKTNPLKADTDGDGLSDKAELTGFTLKNYGTVRPDPLKADSDGDGLSDYAEVVTGTSVWTATHYTTLSSPNVADTDRDGLSDRREHSLHTSPRRKDTDGDGVSDYTEAKTAVTVQVKTKKAYKAYSSPLRKDTDHDKKSDAAERQRGTDPTLKDTDRDGANDNVDRYPLTAKKK